MGYLESQIAARRARLEALDVERAVLVAQLAAYEDVLARSANSPAESITGESREQSPPTLSVSSAWFVVLKRMGDFTYFNASDLEVEALQLYKEEKLRKSLTKDGIRAQLSIYTKKGILKRRGGGQYLLSRKTRLALGLTDKMSSGQSSRNTAGDAR